ncbi:efflux RND transporter periplasmic adaptor subunit [Haloferula sp. A504]|uniref:efflux RND transporter periplasmic adaptor subunit n=1 Tax=Haloferula sp. A504 TaxID=3373601 RepID=UPI0031C10B96|nr:efflux RND transporter periplasmic adaptor subunit [Verrucomicrobiaceae bacterium E54]
MKRLVLILPLLLLAGCGKKAEAPTPQPLPVTVAPPSKREVVVYREFPSTLVGAQEIEIRARVRGTLSLAADVPDFAGKRVQKGAPLFVIEPEPYEQQSLAAQAAVDRAVAARDLARKRYERVQRAAQTNAVSEIDVEIAAAELAETEAAISQAEASLEEAKINEGYTAIEAPISGRMSRLMVDPGNLVGATDSTLLATIIDDSEILAYFEVPEREALRYFELRDSGAAEKVYQKEIRLKLADGSIHAQTGRIDYIENKVDPATRTVKVRAVFPNESGALNSGIYGLIGYPAGPDPTNPTATEALLVPSAAILRDLGGNYVWVVDEDNIVRRRPVDAGDAVEKPVTDPNMPRTLETVVTKGLDGTEKVIISGLQRAREGAPVTPVPAEPIPKAEPPSTDR